MSNQIQMAKTHIKSMMIYNYSGNDIYMYIVALKASGQINREEKVELIDYYERLKEIRNSAIQGERM